MAANVWTFRLAQSPVSTVLENPAVITEPGLPAAIGELTQARNKQIQIQLNRPGSCTFTVPLLDALTAEIDPLTTCILAYRGDELKWSGPVWTMEESAPDDSVQVSAIGWLELLNHRLTTARTIYTNVNDLTILQTLLTDAKTRKGLPIGVGAASGASQLRTRTYERFSNVGQSMQELSDIENGADYEVDPVTRDLLVSRRIGTTTDVIFGYGWGPLNVQALTRQIDASTMANYVVALGSLNQAAEAPPDTPNSAAQNTYGLFEDVASLSDVGSPETLLAYAGAEVLYRETPRHSFTIVPVPAIAANVPVPLADYQLGDIVFLTAKRGRLDVDAQPIRIFGMTIAIDENGIERVTGLQTVAQ